VSSGPGGGLLGHQVTERGVAVLVHGGVEADVVASPGEQVEHPVEVHAELGGDLLGLGVAAELALQGAASAADLVELLHDVHRQPHDARLLGDAACDRLTHPPRGVRRELVALGVVELLHGPDQPGVALLDQVEHGHLRAAVLARDRDDQAQVGVDELLSRGAALLGEPDELLLGGRERRAALLAADAALGEERLGVQTGLDRLGELHLGGGVEQRRPGDLVEVQPDAVAALDLAARADGSCCHVALLLRRDYSPVVPTSTPTHRVPGGFPRRGRFGPFTLARRVRGAGSCLSGELSGSSQG
jgi:hypothetical protein